MKKFLIALLSILVLLAFGLWAIHTPMPQGEKGPRAEGMADAMLEAINADAWKAIPFISWTFRGENHYVWDKVNHVAQVKWAEYEVVLNLNTQEGEARKSGNVLPGNEADEAIQKAYANWANDSFWLSAPAKVRDGGTERFLVTLDDGKEALLVKYNSGGVTPGDAYMWVPGEDGLPDYYRMWVQIIPIGGLKATWDGWEEHEGAMIATQHALGPASIPISNIRTGQSPADFNLPDYYFTQW